MKQEVKQINKSEYLAIYNRIPAFKKRECVAYMGFANPSYLTNHVFFPFVTIEAIAAFIMMIFNRWGELIFASKDDEIGWNGKNKGVVCEQNTYIYRAQIKTVYGNTVYKAGHISLLSNLK
jgi:gliding motility-associated-like protein